MNEAMTIHLTDQETRRCPLTAETRRRIGALNRAKRRLNAKKLEAFGGQYNTDDHGFIYMPKFRFEAEGQDADGYVTGQVNLGRNLGRYLAATPLYIHPASALAGCWVGNLPNYIRIRGAGADLPPELAARQQRYRMWANGIGGMNHLGPDLEIGLALGLPGLLDRLEAWRERNAPAGADFYAAHEPVIRGMLRYAERHRDEARRRAEQRAARLGAGDEVAENYRAMAETLERLLAGPPLTLRDACQFLAIFQSADRSYYLGGAGGQLDELLRPYYERDRALGLVTDDEVVWYLASLFYNDTHYWQLGGQSPDGTHELATRMSFLVLQAAHELAIPYNLALRVYPGMDRRLLRRSLEYTLERGSGPSYSCATGIEAGYMRQGHRRQLARLRAKVGCNWVALPGIEYPLQDVTRLNLGQAWDAAWRDVLDDGETEPTLERLWERFTFHVDAMVEIIREGYDLHLDRVGGLTPELVLNFFCHGPLERGLNASDGGVDIINLNLDGIALATVADSFAAVEQRVVREGRIRWRELDAALAADFEGYEAVQAMLRAIPRFGSPGSLAQDWAERIRTHYVASVTRAPTPRHQIPVIPGLFSHGDIFKHGEDLPATPNGRRSGEAISHSSEPDPGFARGIAGFSPTLKANAVAAVQPGWGNSAPLHLDIDTDLIGGAAGIGLLEALILGHDAMGGTLINLNCVTREQILRAHEDPDLEPDLVVRVTGYSAFFASLSRDYRQQVVDRYLSRG